MITKKLSEINLLPKTAGIYAIVNVLNGKKYIGSTNNFKRRLVRHRSELKNNHHHSIPLQRAYNKYGEDKFIVHILELCEAIKDTLLMLELKYLDLKPEYNVSKTANRPSEDCKKPITEETRLKLRLANLGKKASEEARKNQSIARKGKGTKAIELYDLNGNYITSYDSLADAAIAVSGNYWNQSSIGACCKGRHCTAFGYLWKYKNDNRNILDVVKKTNGSLQTTSCVFDKIW